MTQFQDLPEDVLITLILEHLSKETPILSMVDKFLYQIIHTHRSLKIIHYKNYQNNKHWVNILTNSPELINWVFFESKLKIQIKSSVCPPFIAPFVTHPNFQNFLSIYKFKKLHPDVLISLISNNLNDVAKSFVSSSEIQIIRVLMGLCHPKEIPLNKYPNFEQCLSFYYKSNLNASYLINLIQTFVDMFNPQFIESIVIDKPQYFLNNKTSAELLQLLCEICNNEFWFCRYSLVKYIPHLFKEVPKTPIKYLPHDAYYIQRLLSIDNFINDFSLVCFVMEEFPFSCLLRKSHCLWPLLMSHCSNVGVLNYFHQRLPFPKEMSIQSIKSMETFAFFKTCKFPIQSNTSHDLRLLILFQSNLNGFEQSKLAEISVTAIKNNYFHSSLPNLLISKSSAKKIANYLETTSYLNMMLILEKLCQLFLGSERKFQFFHKLLLRSAIMEESVSVIFSLSHFYDVHQSDLEFSLKHNKTASSLLIEDLLN